jgi:hypothetical protein
MKGFFKQRKVFTLAAALTLCLFQAKEVVAAPILDQSFDATGGTASQAIYSGQSLAQTFTVGIDGYLDSVSLMLNRYSDTTDGDFTLNIFSTSSGTPDEVGDIFFSQTYSVFDLAGDSAFDFNYTSFDTSSANINVSAGDVLAMSVTHTGDNNNWLSWDVNYELDYTGGEGFYKNGLSNSLWATSIPVDRGFQTFVDSTRIVSPAQVPEPSTLALLCLGLFGLGWSRTKQS